MKKNIVFKITNDELEGILEYGNGNLIRINTYIHNIKDAFKIMQLFNLSGIINNKEEFFALDCDLKEESFPLIEIDIRTLYVGMSNIDKDTKNIKKCEFRISNRIPFIKSIHKINISKYDFNIKFNETIIIEFNELVSLNELNQILFNLKIFLQLLVLNEDIEIIEKYFYLEDETKIEEIMKYQINENQQKTNYLIDDNDNLDFEKSLNLWFEAKSKYGKIFDYLSGILKETTLKHIEFKLFALSQWVEAYSTVLFKTENMEKHIKKVKEKELKNAINASNLLDEEKNNLIDNWCYDTKGHTFVGKLQQLFDKNDFFKNLFDSNENLLKDIKDYRNNLTHLNPKDNLNTQQAINLYELLKNLIYLFIMEELQLQNDRNYNKYMKEVKYIYKKYYNLSKLFKNVNNPKFI